MLCYVILHYVIPLEALTRGPPTLRPAGERLEAPGRPLLMWYLL